MGASASGCTHEWEHLYVWIKKSHTIPAFHMMINIWDTDAHWLGWITHHQTLAFLKKIKLYKSDQFLLLLSQYFKWVMQVTRYHLFLVRDAIYTQTDNTLLGYGCMWTTSANSTSPDSLFCTPVLRTFSITPFISVYDMLRGKPHI